jgi:hypothetical protein
MANLRGEHGKGVMTKGAAPQASTEIAQSYEPTPEERAALVAHLARMEQKPPAPRIKLTQKGENFHTSTDHPMPLFGRALVMQALGTADADFFESSERTDKGASGSRNIGL